MLDNFISLLQHYRLFLLLFFSAMFAFVWILQFQKDIRIKWYSALLLAFECQILGVLGTYVLAQAENLISSGGDGVTSLFGCFLAVPLLLLIDSKVFHRNIRMMSDIYSINILFGIFFARINCLFAGCCSGIHIESWGFEWPAREAELVFDLIIGFILTRRCFKRRFDGKNMPILLIGYGAFRFANEFLRKGDPVFFGAFHMAHLWCTIVIIIGIVSLAILHNRDKKNNVKPMKRPKSA